MGAIVVRTQHWEPLWRYIQRTSPSVTSQDAYLVLRGVRTAAVRLKQHEATGMLLAHWLENKEEVARSDEHTSELQSLLRISYAVLCLNNKTQSYNNNT